MMRGKINAINKPIGKKKSAFICLYEPLPNEDNKTPIFFENDLRPGVQFDALTQRQEIEFELSNKRMKDGKIVAIDVRPAAISDSSITKSTAVDASQIPKGPCSIGDPIIEHMKGITATRQPDDFEDAVFLLLRLLGIHSLFQYDRKKQAGRADGVFQIGKLSVMYDCTLLSDYKDAKADQIENYAKRMSEGKLDVKATCGRVTKKTILIGSNSCQVWIVTKGISREIEHYGKVKVREVAVSDLVKLLAHRLSEAEFEEDDLADRLLGL